MQKPKIKIFCDFGKTEINIRTKIKKKSKTEGEILKNEATKIPPIRERQKEKRTFDKVIKKF
jgi:hypothetical protein